ncbi:MAG: hypothetical protein A2W31_03110, partial [Planctomycetes bacterium RBG_16_64_10]
IGVWGDQSCPRLQQAVHCRNCPVFADAGQQLFERETPPDYARQWAQQLAIPDDKTDPDLVSVLVFRVGAEWLAIDIRLAIEVVEPRTIHRVPQRTNRLFLGLVNIRGELQLCASLRALLGIAPEEPADGKEVTPARLLVAEFQGSRWVFPMEEVDAVHRVPSGALEAVPSTVERSARFYSDAMFTLDHRRIGLLSEQRLHEALETTTR